MSASPAALEARSCVVIPFRGSPDQLADCLESLLPGLPPAGRVVLVDDGSPTPAREEPALAPWLADERLHLIRHDRSRGPAGARNHAIGWCRAQGIELVVLLDADCLAPPRFVQDHCALHARHPEAVCIGGAIQGSGAGPWARIDGMMSWFTSLPDAPPRQVTGMYHIPTTNMSFKLSRLPMPGDVFQTRLRTGEDVAFVHELLEAGAEVRFAPQPVIVHRDRTGLRPFLDHQWRWGVHTYAVRFAPRGWGPARRLGLAGAILGTLPGFAAFCTAANMVPLARSSRWNLLYAPPIYAVYLYKSVGVLAGILDPQRALLPEPGGA